MSKKIWSIIIGIIFIVGGIFILFNPATSINNLVKYMGVILFIAGILRTIYSLIDKDYNYLSTGIMNIIFGIILFFASNITINLISILLASFLITSGVLSLIFVYALQSPTLSMNILITSIMKILIGLIIIATPIITWIFTGITLGIILIIIGIIVMFSYKDKEVVYKVKIKN